MLFYCAAESTFLVDYFYIRNLTSRLTRKSRLNVFVYYFLIKIFSSLCLNYLLIKMVYVSFLWLIYSWNCVIFVEFVKNRIIIFKWKFSFTNGFISVMLRQQLNHDRYRQERKFQVIGGKVEIFNRLLNWNRLTINFIASD